MLTDILVESLSGKLLCFRSNKNSGHSPWGVESDAQRWCLSWLCSDRPIGTNLIKITAPSAGKNRSAPRSAWTGVRPCQPGPGIPKSNNFTFLCAGPRATPPSVVVPFPSSPPSTLHQSAPGSCCRPAQRFPPASPSSTEYTEYSDRGILYFAVLARSLARLRRPGVTVSRLNLEPNN